MIANKKSQIIRENLPSRSEAGAKRWKVKAISQRLRDVESPRMTEESKNIKP
jgi:hypothetical protein